MVLQQTNIFGEGKDICVSKQKAPQKTCSDNLLSNKYKQLYDIYEQIYNTLNIDLFEQRESIEFDNVIAYPEDRQAEIKGTQSLSLDERIRRNNDYLENRKKEIERP